MFKFVQKLFNKRSVVKAEPIDECSCLCLNEDNCDEFVSANEVIDMLLYFKQLLKVAEEQHQVADANRDVDRYIFTSAESCALEHVVEVVQELLKDNGIHIET